MSRGELRVYLGAAPGVGKTYAMLNEGWRRRQRGTDVVVGWIETHGRAETASQVRELEVVPPRVLLHRGEHFAEMDVHAVLRRHPSVVLVDELAHTNVPGSSHDKRWQDVEELLDAGITVLSTLNIQHLESLNDVVAAITGVLQHDTVPDTVVRAADQVELVDMTPEALRRRMAHGHIHPPERVDMALANYFRSANLAALRELALLWVADNVEEQLAAYRKRHGIDGPWETRERVVVALTGAANGEQLIRRAARMARRAKGDLIAVHVRSDAGLSAAAPVHLDDQRSLVGSLGGTYREVLGSDVADALVRVARAEDATQIVLGTSHRSRWERLSTGSVVNRVLARSGERLDVHVISSAEPPRSREDRLSRQRRSHVRRARMGHRRLERLTRWPGALTRRRRWTGIAIALAVPVPATLVLHAIRGDVSLPDVSLLYLLPVLLASAVGGVVAGVLASLEGFVLFNWFSNPPLRTLVNPRDVLALAVFLAVGVAVSLEVDLAESRTVDARRVRSHAAALARATNVLLEDPDPLPALVEEVRRTFLVEGVTVLRSHGRQWEVEVAAGAHPPSSPEEASLCLPVREGRVLTLSASELSADDMEALRSFVAQIAVALATHELRDRAAESTALAKANEIRTALLAAVSHDLRTPLASIKAAATTFLPEDVPWDPPTVRALLETIDAEADRLHALVDNLLDMSRLSTGALAVQLRPVGFDEAVAAAVNSLPKDDHRVHLDVLDMLPPVVADLPLLERAIANLLSNALAASGPDSPVRVIAGRLPGIWSELRIIDRGPGIAPSDRERIFLPFQRLGDRSAGAGIGLGLAVAKGFVEAMGGELSVEDTPGGGATMALRLRTATTRPMEVVDARASGGRSQHVQCQRTPTAGEAHATDMPVVPAATSNGRAR